jgi:fatty-acid desaturase
MSFLAKVLDEPSYGWTRDGKLYVPTHREILAEFFGRMNIFRSRKNWLPLTGWTFSLSLAIPLTYFLFHFNWKLFVLGFIYSMVFMGTYGTVWLHRYSTHRAYKFSNPFARFICRNLVIKILPEEIYVLSHHVHHGFSEQPGDPYNVHGGWLYCFLGDAIHQMIRPDMSEEDYLRTCKMMEHTGVKMNTYAQYLKWGSVCHPLRTLTHYVLNWGFWYGVLFLIGGNALAIAIFGMAGVWAIGVRTYNYDGHGGGVDKRVEGIDFNRKDLSINQVWPGFVAGEWHNNHHLFPNSARCGFLPYQIDGAWAFIRFYHFIGGVSSFRDAKQEFMDVHYLPYLEAKRASAEPAPLL